MARRKIAKPEEKIEKVFISFAQAQEFLGVSHQTIYNLMDKGLPSYKIGKKRVFTKAELVNWVKSQS